MQISRRTFLQAGTAVVVGLGVAPGRLRAEPAPATGGIAARPDDPIIVVCQLSGGNDGLNSVIPFGKGQYYDLRPHLGIKEALLLPLTGGIGLHPKLQGLKELYDAGKVAVIQGVGYPEPDRSHFRSMEIWQTAQPQGTSPVGWLGRILDLSAQPVDSPLKAVAIGEILPRAFSSSKVIVPAIAGLDAFSVQATAGSDTAQDRFRRTLASMYTASGLLRTEYAIVRGRGANALAAAERLEAMAGQYVPAATYPDSDFARKLRLIATMAAGNLGSRLFWVTQDGFDEHSGELGGHGDLMAEFGDSMRAFYLDLKAHNLSRQVLIVAYSEFGRRVEENGSGGTDHGTAGPVFVIGDGVKGGLYGDHPSLTDLDDGDLKYTVDFRQVYATVLEDWLGMPHGDVLGAHFDGLGFVATR